MSTKWVCNHAHAVKLSPPAAVSKKCVERNAPPAPAFCGGHLSVLAFCILRRRWCILLAANYAFTSKCICFHACVCLFVCMWESMHVAYKCAASALVWACVCFGNHIYICMHVYMYVCVCVCAYKWWRMWDASLRLTLMALRSHLLPLFTGQSLLASNSAFMERAEWWMQDLWLWLNAHVICMHARMYICMYICVVRERQSAPATTSIKFN